MPTEEDAIERIVREYVSFIDGRDFDKLRNATYFAPNPSMSFEYGSSAGDSLENHVRAFEEHCKIFPGRRVQIVGITVTLESPKLASALLETSMTDGSGLKIPGATLITFRKLDGEWQATDVSGMRGSESVSTVQNIAQSSEGQEHREDQSTTYLRKNFANLSKRKP